MLNFAIHNEMGTSDNLPPFLTLNPSNQEMSIMAKIKDNLLKLQCQSDIGIYQLPLFEVAANGTAVCLVCHKPFRTRTAYGKTQKTCSRKCCSIMMTTAAIVFCEQCGDPIRVKSCEKETRKYCSYECYYIGSKGQRRSTATEFKKGLVPQGGISTRFKTGDAHPLWKGGISSEGSTIRHSCEYKEWRTQVYMRDHYECQHCGIHCKSGEIVAHHIKSFADYEHLRFYVDNGITLCRSCHLSLHHKQRTLQ